MIFISLALKKAEFGEKNLLNINNAKNRFNRKIYRIRLEGYLYGKINKLKRGCLLKRAKLNFG